MKKKTLSLALALAMCLGLTVPAFAVGETTVKDEQGLEYTLSNPVLGTETYKADAMLSIYSRQNTVTVYLVPEGTVIKPVKFGSVPVDEARKMSEETSGSDYELYYEIFDINGEGGDELVEEEGFALTWPGVQPVISRLYWQVSLQTDPNSPIHGNGASSGWTSGAICFKIAEESASPTNDKLEVNGAAANPTVYKIGDSNYFKIRDVAALLNGTEKQFAVGYDGEKNAVTATPGQGYDRLDTDLAGPPSGGSQDAELSNDAIYVNGEKITAEVYKIGGSNYFKLRDLGRALDFYVGWSAERGIYIETSRPYSE